MMMMQVSDFRRDYQTENVRFYNIDILFELTKYPFGVKLRQMS